MILNRLGNKKKIAVEIQRYFPKHDVYMEPFFGAGGMFFNKPKAKFNFCNDIDNDVYNLFRCLTDKKDELTTSIELTPITETLIKDWAYGKKESTDIGNATRFIFLSNFLLYGKGSTLRIGAVNPKRMILQNIDETFKYLQSVYFFNCDFRNFFKKCDYKSNIHKAFCYCDPPYLGTSDNYSASFKENDSFDLFETLTNSGGVKFAMSEFNHPFIIEQAAQRGLNIIEIGERKNLMNRRIEILVTNYETPQLNLFN